MSKKVFFVILAICISAGLVFAFSMNQNCSGGWYVTGYYTPLEENFEGDLTVIEVDGKEFALNENFLNTVKIEGWGKTSFGNYIGWYDERYHFSDSAKDSRGKNLIITMVASDSNVLEYGTKITIPTLPEPWDSRELVVSDIGPSIIGKHIDVFTGEGELARIETERITGQGNTLCVV